MQSLGTAPTGSVLLAAPPVRGGIPTVGLDSSQWVETVLSAGALALSPDALALALVGSMFGIAVLLRRRRRSRHGGFDGNYRDVFHGMDEAVVVQDAETLEIVDANRAAADLYGYSVPELRRLNVMDLTAAHPEFDAATVEEKLERTVEDGSQRFDWPIEREDGERRWVEVSLTRASVEGNPRVLAVIRDVTDRKARIDDLERYETLAETVVDGLYITGPNGHFTYANEELAALMGYDREELLGMHIADVTPSPEVDRAWELRDDLEAAPDQTKTQEFDLFTASGDTVPVEIRFTALPFSDGSQGTAGVVRDVSDRKRHEHQLEALHAVTRDLMTASDADVVAARASEALEELLEFPINGVLFHEDGRLDHVTISPDAESLFGSPPSLPTEGSVAGEVFRTGEPRVFDDVDGADGVYDPDTPVRSECIFPLGEFGVLIVASTAPNAFDRREVELVRVLAANVRAALERTRIETELERQNARLEEFASIVTHDLRNPMNVAEGHLELARELDDLSRLDDVDAAFDRMSAIIEEGLTFARVEGEMETAVLDLEAVARRAWDMVATGDATLIVEAEGLVRANEERLLTLFENLFRNSFDHGGEGVTVRVGWLADGDEFYVEDTGPGIPPSERERVFEAGHTTAESGTGLGLSIVRTVADVHGWDHGITDGECGGARFEFSGVEAA
ncbi:PAS domain S-box protein [Halostella sp. JP-L12]|uniref:sensor histidine kinase n=1 Tax=Halostella TaxID=1843185 RepID=UPI000EF80A12|nr:MULTISPECIES: PAS domain S-box protein [Halostella]NHN46313.1 PAS domain S-box protein [Halostella sp. JP-L12]